MSDSLKTFADIREDARGHAGRCPELQQPGNRVCMCSSDRFACTRCGKGTHVYLIEIKDSTPDKWFGWCYTCQHTPVDAAA
jgi:hypothetical protein